MRNRSPIFYGLVLLAVAAVVIVVMLAFKDIEYFLKLSALEGGNTRVVTGKLLVIHSAYDLDLGRNDVRDIKYIFDVDNKQYDGVAQDNGQSTNEIAIKYLVSDPSVSIPNRVDIAGEKGLALLRIGAELGVLGIGVAVASILRRRA